MNPRTKKLLRYSAILGIVCVVCIAVAFRLSPPDFRGHRLLNAARDGGIFRVRLCLLLGTDINYSTGSGNALHMATYHGNIELMRFLLAHGSDVNARAKYDITPLYVARSNGHREAELLLLENGADPDTSHINPI